MNAVLSAPRFVETVRELRNLIAGKSPSMPGVLPHAYSARKACPDTVVSLFHNSFFGLNRVRRRSRRKNYETRKRQYQDTLIPPVKHVLILSFPCFIILS